MQTTTPTPDSLLARRRIVTAFVTDEEGFLEAAIEAGRRESATAASERYRSLAEQPLFGDFLAWISLRDPLLTEPVHWLVYGPNLVPDTRPFGFGEYQRLTQRVRETRPDFKPLLHQILCRSLLATVATQTVQPAAVSPPVRFIGSESSVEVATR